MSFLYEIYCSECDADLELIKGRLDNSFDLIIGIAPCSTCIDNAVKDKEEEYQARMDESRIQP